MLSPWKNIWLPLFCFSFVRSAFCLCKKKKVSSDSQASDFMPQKAEKNKAFYLCVIFQVFDQI